MSEQVVDVDRALCLELALVLAHRVHDLAAPVRDLVLGQFGVALRGRGGRRLGHQPPEELDVQVAFGAGDGAVVQLARGQRVELLEGGHGLETIRGPGAPNKKPWPSGQPSSRRRAACSSLSTPSPIASIPNARASEMIAVTIAASPREATSAATNERSILTAWTGRSRSDE